MVINIISDKPITEISEVSLRENCHTLVNLLKNCALILTDSGGVQEESTFRKVPCITLRKNTERPITIEQGTNTLSDLNSESIVNLIADIRDGNYKKGEIPLLWDGFSTKRIIEFLNKKL